MKLQEYIEKLKSGKMVSVDASQLIKWLETATPDFNEKLDSFIEEVNANDIKTIEMNNGIDCSFELKYPKKMTGTNMQRIIYQAASINELNIEFLDNSVISVTNGSDNPMGDVINELVKLKIDIIRYRVECSPDSDIDYCITCKDTIDKKLWSKLSDELRRFGFRAILVHKANNIADIELTHIYNVLSNEPESFNDRVEKFEVCVRSLFLRYDIDMIKADYDHNSGKVNYEFGGSLLNQKIMYQINSYADKYGFDSNISSSSDEGVTKITIIDR